MTKNILIFSLFLALIILGFYTLHFRSTQTTPQKQTQISEGSSFTINDIPESFSSINGPTYYRKVDVDQDTLPETVIILPTATNHSAGKMWVIKDGVVIFDSGSLAQISFEPTPDFNGFTLSYSPTMYIADVIKVRYVYENGEFTKKHDKELFSPLP